MDNDELLARAKRYRELAANVTDLPTRRGLLDRPEKYEALARGDDGLDDAFLTGTFKLRSSCSRRS
jgi:hypothetical protein